MIQNSLVDAAMLVDIGFFVAQERVDALVGRHDQVEGIFTIFTKTKFFVASAKA